MIKWLSNGQEKTDMSDVACMVVDSYNHIDQALEKEWDELAIQTKGSIYLTCAWSRIWWEFYGKKKHLRIFFYRVKGKLVGVIPVYIEQIRIGLVVVRIARLVDAYNPKRVFDLPLFKEHAESVGKHLARHLVGTDRCDLISIGPVSDECEAKKSFFASAKKIKKELGVVQDVHFGVYTHFDLSNTFDAYMHTLSKSERKNRQYYEKRLAKEYDIHSVVIREPDKIESEMPQFAALHAAQWRKQGRLGYFNAWPLSDAFNRHLAVELARLGRTRLIKISNGEIPIIYEYYYLFGNCSYWQLSARIEGEEWDRLSLGATGAVAMIRETIEEGITKIEGGVAHYEYKTRLGGIESNISILRVTARQPISIAKYHLCVLLQKLYIKLYYRLWYSRIQPKLPSFFHRPIWVNYTSMIF